MRGEVRSEMHKPARFDALQYSPKFGLSGENAIVHQLRRLLTVNYRSVIYTLAKLASSLATPRGSCKSAAQTRHTPPADNQSQDTASNMA